MVLIGQNRKIMSRVTKQVYQGNLINDNARFTILCVYRKRHHKFRKGLCVIIIQPYHPF